MSALSGSFDLTVSGGGILVLDVHCFATAAGGAGDTIQVGNGANAITNAMDLNVGDTTLVRAANIDVAFNSIADGGVLRVTGASAANALVIISGVKNQAS